MPQESRTEDSKEISGVTKNVRRYIEKRLELFALTVGKQVSQIMADSIQQLIGIMLFAGGLLFAWLAFGFYLSELVEDTPLGFLLASLPLLIGGFIFLRLKPKWITRKIQSEIISEFLNTLEVSLDNKPEKTNSEHEENSE